MARPLEIVRTRDDDLPATSELAPLLTPDEVGRLLRVSRWRVYDLAARELAPAVVRLGRTVRFNRDRLAAILRGGE